LSWARQGDASAVFDPDTGQTHFPSDLASLLLEHIDRVPVRLPELIGRLDGPADLAPEALQQIHQALLSLERAELVTSGPTDSN
jgi:PqqD family protein of HPr-rel-A system